MSMTHRQLVKAITDIVPNALFILSDTDFENIEWLDERPKPSWSQVQDALANPLPEPVPTVEDKLASVGLNLDDLKAALGL